MKDTGTRRPPAKNAPAQRAPERGRAEGSASGTETLTLPLSAGTYVAEIYEYSNIEGSSPRGSECFDVTLTIS